MTIPPRILGLIVVGLTVPALAGCGKKRLSKAPKTEQHVEAIADAGPPDAPPDDPGEDRCPACGMG